MSTELERLLSGIGEGWNSHDVERIISFFADDCLYEDLAVGVAKRGKKEVTEFIREFFAGFPDVKFEIRGCFSTNDRVCIEWVMTGTHSGDLPGMPATGKAISIRGVNVKEIKDNKVTRHTDYYDMATLLRQLGVLPPMPPG